MQHLVSLLTAIRRWGSRIRQASRKSWGQSVSTLYQDVIAVIDWLHAQQGRFKGTLSAVRHSDLLGSWETDANILSADLHHRGGLWARLSWSPTTCPTTALTSPPGWPACWWRRAAGGKGWRVISCGACTPLFTNRGSKGAQGAYMCGSHSLLAAPNLRQGPDLDLGS